MSYISGLLYSLYKDGFDKTINNILEDFQMFRPIVRFCFNISSGFFLLILTLANI